MTKRTSPKNANGISTANELDDIVTDKRKNWRASAAKARRRQRRYKKQLVVELYNEAKQKID